MLRVMRKHRAAADEIDPELVPEGLLTAAKQSWDEAVSLGEQHGYRNAQASVLAPTGTIGLMMDCDTTGIEPELALVKTKKLVGGGTMQFVNQTVPRALDRLGYTQDQVEDIVGYIAEHNSVVDAPHLIRRALRGVRHGDGCGADPLHGPRPDDGGGAAVHLRRHLQDREHARGGHGRRGGAALRRVVEAGAEGGRHLPRQLQGGPAAVGGQEEERRGSAEPAEPAHLPWSAKRRLPQSRPARTTSFQVGDAEGYVTAGSYPDDGLGELFLKVSKQGSTLSGIMDAFSIAISVGLQYGVPLEDYASKFINMKFEPSGMTNDPDIRFASSIVDYVFRRLALDHLPEETREGLGIRSIAERKESAQLEAAAKAEPVAPAPRRRPQLIEADASGRARRRSTPRCATSAARRCSPPARATCARVAEAPAAAREVGPRRASQVEPRGRVIRPRGVHRKAARRTGRLVGLHHVQLAMPAGEEEAARRFYGTVLGLARGAAAAVAVAGGRRVVRSGRLGGAPGRGGAVQSRRQGAPGVPRRRDREGARAHRGGRLPRHRHGAARGLPSHLRPRSVRQPRGADRAE